jgi:arylsulfatase A-like enzyme
MLTGLYPPSHGVRLNVNFRVPPAAGTLAELLAARGFKTVAVTSAAVLDGRYGLNQGFDVYQEPPRDNGQAELPAEETTRRALDATSGLARERFFLWVHYYDPHSPFQPPAPFEAPEGIPPESVELYDREIAYMDLWMGKLLEGLEERGMLEETAVIVAGDHGESLGEHGETYHTLFVYDSTQHVPLIIRAPGIAMGKRVSEPVSLVDLFATTLWLLGIEPPETTSSRVLPGLGFPEQDQDRGPPRGIYSESMAPPIRYGWAALQAMRWRQWLYIRAPREELYDLTSDPEQKINLARSREGPLAELRRVLARTVREMPDQGLEDEAGFEPGEEQLRKLAALGYIGATGGEEAIENSLEGEDPKDMVEVAEAYQLSRLAKRLGRLETAEELLHFVVTADPGNVGGWSLYGEILFRQNRIEDAANAWLEALKLQPSGWAESLNLAILKHRLGETPAAERYFYQALDSTPFPEEVWREIASFRLELGDLDKAKEAYRRLLELQPGDERAQRDLQQLMSPGSQQLEAE